MTEFYVARQNKRKALYLPMGGTAQNPSLMFFAPGASKEQTNELVLKQLEKQGITKRSAVNKILTQAEVDYERRIKVAEAQAELRRLMELKRLGAKLIQRGYRKWVPASFRPKST
jgi:hypothetical protein